MTATIERQIEDWLNEQSPATRRGYGAEIQRWRAFLATRDVPLLAATRGDVAAYRNVPGTRASKPAPATIARRIAAVSSFYRYLAVDGIIEASPAAYVKRPKVDPDSATRGMNEAEALDYLHAARAAGPSAWVIVALMMTEGLRISEVLAANIEAVTIHQGAPVLKIMRKGGKRKYVTLGHEALAAIKDASEGRQRGPLAITSRGEAYSYPGGYSLIRRLAYKAGLDQPESIRPHSLRHTFATLSLNAGVPLRDVRDAMSHSSVELTSRYDRARDESERHPVRALEAHLGISDD